MMMNRTANKAAIAVFAEFNGCFRLRGKDRLEKGAIKDAHERNESHQQRKRFFHICGKFSTAFVKM